MRYPLLPALLTPAYGTGRGLLVPLTAPAPLSIGCAAEGAPTAADDAVVGTLPEPLTAPVEVAAAPAAPGADSGSLGPLK